jgi:microcystin-dependent protein
MEVYLGLIKAFPYDYVPLGWLRCEGQTIPIVQNQALYALIGIKFGGDGKTTFALPDLRGAETDPGGLCKYCMCTMGLFPIWD